MVNMVIFFFSAVRSIVKEKTECYNAYGKPFYVDLTRRFLPGMIDPGI